jgi:hypothetical protein
MNRIMLTLIFGLLISLLVNSQLFASDWSSVNKYKQLHKEGYSNCVFATKAIDKNKESRYTFKNKFNQEPVYARCYLPGPVGKVKGKDFWHEIWVDRKLKKRTFFKKPPDANWDQIQIWITEDEYSSVMKSLSSGQHDIILWVIKNEYKGKKAVAETNSAGEIVGVMKEIWVPKSLSKGKFSFTAR